MNVGCGVELEGMDLPRRLCASGVKRLISDSDSTAEGAILTGSSS
jgi:hypothetical protein